MIDSLSSGQDAEKKLYFLNSFVCSMKFDGDKGRFERDLEFLFGLTKNPELVKFIPNLKDYNKITQKAYELIEQLLNTPNIEESKFSESHNPPEYITEEVIQHVKSLFTQGVLQYGPVKCILGFTYSKDEFALSMNLYKVSDEQLNDNKLVERYAIRLIITVLLEMGHLKKTQGYSSGIYKKKTPERFLNESGLCIENQLFGPIVQDRDYIRSLLDEARAAFFNVESWKQPQFLKDIKLVKSTPSPSDKTFLNNSSEFIISNHATRDQDEVLEFNRMFNLQK